MPVSNKNFVSKKKKKTKIKVKPNCCTRKSRAPQLAAVVLLLLFEIDSNMRSSHRVDKQITGTFFSNCKIHHFCNLPLKC